MRKTLLSALGLAAALSGTACTQDKDKVFGRPPEIQRRFDEQQQLPVQSLEDKIIRTASEVTGEAIERLTLRTGFYDSDNFPFQNYRTGTYYFVSTPEDKTRVFYSTKGQPIGVTSKAEGEPGNWVIEEKNKEGKTTYIYKYSFRNGVKQSLYSQGLMDDGNWHRSLYRPFPVYRVAGDRVMLESNPYRGAFGGDGQHVIDDRGKGMFFVVKDLIIDEQGKAIRELGEFFYVKNAYQMEPLYAPVSRVAGSNKFRYEGLEAQELEMYNKVVPRHLQAARK